MKKYSDLLEQFIKNCGISHREVSRRTKEKGVSVSQPYISQLVNGDVNPPSEEVSRILAEVTNGDADELIMAGYVEKAPIEIKNIIAQSRNIDELLKTVFTFYLKFSDISSLSDAATAQGINVSAEALKDLLNEQSIIKFDSLSLKEKIELLDVLNEDAKSKRQHIEGIISDYKIKNEDNTLVKELNEYYSIDNLVKIPVLGTIAAGLPIDIVESVDGFELVGKELLRGREAFFLNVKGDSMIGDNIFNGDRVLVVSQHDVNASDIAVVAINGDTATLKRVKCQNNMCILIPSNPLMEPTLVPAKDVHIIGKVIEVRRSLE